MTADAGGMDAERMCAAIPQLRELSQVVVEHLVSRCTVRRFPPRAVLFRAGDSPRALFFILAGRVRVTRELGAASHVLHYEHEGGLLGEVPLFGGGPYLATATAAEATECALLRARDVEVLLQKEPAFARFALARMAQRARSLVRRVDELSASTITARLAARLLADHRVTSGEEFTLGLTQEALAEELGTAREVLVRSLRSLCDAGALRRAGRARFVVADIALLSDFARRDR